MGIIFFLLTIGTVVFLFLLIDLGLSAFSAIDRYDNDPYQEELNYDDILLARRGGDAFADADARPVHFYNERVQKTPFPSSNAAKNRKMSGVL